MGRGRKPYCVAIALSPYCLLFVSGGVLQVLTDVTTEILVRERNLLSLSKRLCQCLVLILTIRTYSNDTATIGDHLAVNLLGAGMEHYRVLYVADATNLVTLLVSLRITAAYEHYANHRSLVELNLTLVKIAFRDRKSVV